MKYFLLLWLITMIGDNLLPFLLARAYPGYDHKIMALSVLGCRQSPVMLFYNTWCVISGIVFIIGGYMLYLYFTNGVSVATGVLLVLYGLGCELISGIFPLNEDRAVVDISSKVHGLGSALGFTALLFSTLLLGIAAFKVGFSLRGVISVLSFIGALTFFVFFILGEKEGFSDTIFKYGGLWQRMTLLFCYLPFMFFGISELKN